MLLELDIANFAIADHLRIHFSPGLNVITGETGAGKSLMVDALATTLGGRPEPETIRAGADEAHLEAVFADLPQDPDLATALEEAGAAPEDGALVVSRTLRREGRNTGRLNGRAVVQSALTAVGQRLVDIHGQGDYMSLLRPAEHLGLVDRFAGLAGERAQAAGRIAELRRVRDLQNRLATSERERARRLDLLQYEVGQIEAAGLRAEEEEELRARRQLLANAEELTRQASAAIAALEEEESSGVEALGRAAEAAARLAALDPCRQEEASAVAALQSQAAEMARAFREYREGLDADPEALGAVEERLALIADLKRKYGGSVKEVLDYATRAHAELAELAGREERLAELAQRERELIGEVGRLCAGLSRRRRGAAAHLAAALEAGLAELGMSGCRFAVRLKRREGPAGVPVAAPLEEVIEAGGDTPPVVSPRLLLPERFGVEDVEFLVSMNPGEPLRPLARVASGGETSRLILVMKTVLGTEDRIPLLVLDEIDVGLGGRAGRVVGERLRELGRHHQVICITHLPQIASFAERHIVVAKEVVGGRSVVRAWAVEGEERVGELAAMLGTPSPANKAAAWALVKEAAAFAAALTQAG